MRANNCEAYKRGGISGDLILAIFAHRDDGTFSANHLSRKHHVTNHSGNTAFKTKLNLVVTCFKLIFMDRWQTDRKIRPKYDNKSRFGVFLEHFPTFKSTLTDLNWETLTHCIFLFCSTGSAHFHWIYLLLVKICQWDMAEDCRKFSADQRPKAAWPSSAFPSTKVKIIGCTYGNVIKSHYKLSDSKKWGQFNPKDNKLQLHLA